ncbi:MAG: 50S ribosomal protein L6 [Thermoplasmatales archaeon SG8-52-3]|nr:MAG: 50S ribosomal protein L6 [Thermoplasmatales archaeon SG8-52-3]
MVKTAAIKEEIKIPDGVTVTLDNNILTVNGEKGELKRTFSHPKINIMINGKAIEVNGKNVRRKELALIGTIIAHTKNMIKGVTEGFEYKMKTVFSHFPIKTSVEGNEFIIQNFLGERSARKAEILEGVSIEIKGEDITVQGIDKEKVGQTVANIERATAVKRRDTRVFQDGVYRISRGGK